MGSALGSQMRPIAKHQRLHLLGTALGKQRVGTQALQRLVLEHRHAVPVESVGDDRREVLAGQSVRPLGSVGIVVADAGPKSRSPDGSSPRFRKLGRVIRVRVRKYPVQRQIRLLDQPDALVVFAANDRDPNLHGFRLGREVPLQQTHQITLAVLRAAAAAACLGKRAESCAYA